MTFTRVVTDALFARAGARVPRRVWQRARALPALSLPVESRRRRLATLVSIGVHALLLWVLLRPGPVTNLNPDLVLPPGSGLGPGPAGGGGGGTRGTGGVKFVRIAPPPTPVPPQVAPVVPPVEAVIEPPKPVVTAPVMPQLELPKAAAVDPKAEVKVESPVIGTGGGTGNDGTTGNGPGSGGGIGTGIGTGRGSGTGPGTGGGAGDHSMPHLIEMPILPLPVPDKVKGTLVKAVFDVGADGKVLDFEFTPTKDGDYNRKLRDLFKSFRFRAASTADGVPIRAKYPFSMTLY